MWGRRALMHCCECKMMQLLWKTIRKFLIKLKISSVQFLSVSNSLRPHGLQHTRLPCPPRTPGVYSNSSPLIRWCHPTISSSIAFLSPLPSIFPSIRVFSNESDLCIRWPKSWNFSFSSSPSNEYSGLISFRINWFDLLALKSPQNWPICFNKNLCL